MKYRFTVAAWFSNLFEKALVSLNYLAFFFFQRVAAAFLAISRRFLADSRFALAKPPLWPSSTAAWFFLWSVCGDSWISPAAIRMT